MLAKPMICPNLRTDSPSAIAFVAILWPFGTRLTAVTPSATAPGRIGSIETITLSSGWSRRTRGACALSEIRIGITLASLGAVMEFLRGGRRLRARLLGKRYGGSPRQDQTGFAFRAEAEEGRPSVAAFMLGTSARPAHIATMSARDRWTLDLKCTACGNAGTAYVSEEGYPYLQDPQFSVDSLNGAFSVKSIGQTALETTFKC